jgi:HSP20 family molecular chaperone IbpA
MFKKKKCPRCKKKIGESYSFCPYCGNRFDSENDGEWGMLGKNDFISPMNEIKLPIGFNALFNSIMRNLNKELDGQLNRDFFHRDKPQKIKKDGISISISTFGNSPPKIKVTQLGDKQQKTKETEKIKSNIFTKEKIKQFMNLPKEEPETKIRRLSNKVIYEIEMPGVESKENISIMKLENSIEIKAIARNKAYKKIIPISLPIKNYNLSNGKLILELGIKN